MNQYFSIFAIILVWIISFVEPSGWSMMFHLPEKVNILIVTISLFILLFSKRRLPITQNMFWLLLIFLIIVPYLLSSKWDGASYSVAFLTTYIISVCKITPKVIKYTAWTIAVLGLFILYIYTRGSVLRGWNENAISMVGLFSFLYFCIFLIEKRGTKAFWFWNIVTVVYLQLLFQLDCRSGMLFSVLAVVAVFYSQTTKNILKGKKKRLLLLNVPLIISFIMISLASSTYFSELDQWSMQKFDKHIFNERDVLWVSAYEQLVQSAFLGTGKFLINYHNSGVAAISVFGVIGYILWIKFFSKSLTKLSLYISDNIVFGSILAFMLIFLQQSFDLGFISDCPNLLPYMILGVGLGRINYLKLRRR